MFQVVYVLIQESYEDDRHGVGESLDVLFFADMILGTTGVPYVFVIFHLWVRVKCFIEKFDWMSFSGTMRTSMVPKTIRLEKYSI